MDYHFIGVNSLWPSDTIWWHTRCIWVNIGFGNGLLVQSSLFKISFKLPRGQRVNSLAPGKFEWNFKHVIFKQISVTDGWSISCEIALIWMALDFSDDQSTLVQVMAWCRQAASHCLSQCWPRSMSPYGVTRPQWVKIWAWEWSLWKVPLYIRHYMHTFIKNNSTQTVSTFKQLSNFFQNVILFSTFIPY